MLESVRKHLQRKRQVYAGGLESLVLRDLPPQLADEAWDPSSSPRGYRQVLLQQSVTMLAYMDRTTQNGTQPTTLSEDWSWWSFGKVSVHDLPILIGAAAGAVVLILFVMALVIVWHCCRHRTNQEKVYSLESKQENGSLVQSGPNIVQSDSVVFLSLKPKHLYQTQAIETNKGIVARSKSLQPITDRDEHKLSFSKKRPLSHPAPSPSASPSQPTATLPKPAEARKGNTLGLNSIPEITMRSYDCLQDVPSISNNFYQEYSTNSGAFSNATSSVQADRSSHTYHNNVDPEVAMKTRSLPVWGHSRPRPLSTEDDLNELYAKVSFSKKRKNRMRNDSAAAIAVNKSKSTFVSLPFNHKDTDSLVANEAVVVYDERTAL